MRIHPALHLIVVLGLSSCDDSGGPSSNVVLGTLSVSTSTVGDDPDQDGYLLTVDGVDSVGLEPTGTAELALSPGRHGLTLLSVASQCTVSPGADLEVEVLSRSTTPVAFDISYPATGARVQVTTTGAEFDPDDYRVLVDQSDRGSISRNGTMLIRLDPGNHAISLTGLEPNCGVNGPGSSTIVIVAAAVTPVQFAVVCAPTNSIGSNLQLNTTSLVPGRPALSLAGGIARPAGSSLVAALHVEGSHCFDPLATVHLTGTQTGTDISLTSASIDGQVMSLAGSLTVRGLDGTYAIEGGCAGGDRGDVSGSLVASVNGRWRMIFDVNEQHVGFGIATLEQGSLDSEGSFGLIGTASDNISPCYSGTISAGTFPSPSFSIGTSVVLEIKTGDGTVVFRGTQSESGSEIIGRHLVVGGRCDGYGGGHAWGETWAVPATYPSSAGAMT